MKRLISYTITLLVLAAATTQAQTPPAKSIAAKTIESLSTGKIELTIPRLGAGVERIVLENGLTLYFYEDHKLPLFNITTLVRCGSIYDPLEKNGLSSLVGSVMRSGGTKSISGDSLSILLEYIGGSLETSIGMESGSASLSVLSKDQDLGLKLLADLLRNPLFPQEKLDLAKTDMKNQIKRRNDSPSRMVSTYFSNTIYGDHPNGRILDWSSVKGLTVQDLVDYHQRFFVPNGIFLGISGDFNKTELLSKITQYFGDWKKSSQPLPSEPEVAFTYRPGVYQINKDISQAYLMIGELGIKRDNPDRYAVGLLNFVLGGGSFTSRLTSRVRSDEGLAYHVGSSFDTDTRDYGTFAADCQTKSATAYKATKIITEEIEKIRKEGITEQELEEARNSIINRLVFNFDTSSKLLRNLMSLEFDGYPLDYYEKYLDNYRRVTLADIKQVAQKYLKPDQLSYVVVGKPETFEKPLSEFVKITNIEPAKPVIE
ncbi:MAG: insulinase family protein [Candidatus Zixiibacteriota bacterium]|nr:MAG: insulinase family protein [candidate division Zixibacteria bacterium]